MDLPFDRNTWQTANDSVPKNPEIMSAPPPPIDYTIRTMERDISTLSQTGGNTINSAHFKLTNEPVRAEKTGLNPVILFGGLIVLVLAVYFAFLYNF